MTPKNRKTDMTNYKIKELIVSYGTYIAIATGMFTFGYKTFAEPLVRDTARQVAVSVADSVVAHERKIQEEANKKIAYNLKIIQNYMKLQDKKLFEKAKELEEN